MMDGENKLIEHAIRGRSSAFGSLYDYYQPKIYRFVLIKVSRREDAEDLTHQVFLSAFQNIKNYKDLGHPFGSWLYRIARNQVTDFYRSQKKDVDLESVNPEYFAVPASAQFAVASKMELEKVKLALGKLQPDHQEVIVMRFIEDLPVKEVAEAMEKSEGAVKVLQHRAIKELKKHLTHNS